MRKTLLSLPAILLFIACGTFKVEDEADGESYAVTIIPSIPDELTTKTPLTLFIINPQDKSVEQQEITEYNSPIYLSLPESAYTLMLCSGLTGGDYFIDNNLLYHKTANCSPVPFIQGSTDIHLSEDTDINLTLTPSVAALTFAFTGLPANTEAVSLQVTPVSSSLSLSGGYANDSQACTVTCQETNGTWSSETIYVFPEEETTRTRLSIQITHDGENDVYSYTYKQPLTAGQPYRFTGNFENNNFNPDGEFEIAGWQPGIDVEFDFKETTGNEEEDNNSGEEENMETIYATTLPESDCIWGQFYVWRTDTVIMDEEVIATLISPYQWYLYAEEALSTLAAYQVDDFTNWRTFSVEEAKEFSKQHQGNLYDLNEFIEAYGIDGFKKEGRYLCSQADSTFSFSNNMILKSGKTVKYYLRGIKKVRVIQK